MITQTKQLGNGWTMEIRFNQRTTYKLRKGSTVLPLTFYSEQALLDWAREMNIDFGGSDGIDGLVRELKTTRAQGRTTKQSGAAK